MKIPGIILFVAIFSVKIISASTVVIELEKKTSIKVSANNELKVIKIDSDKTRVYALSEIAQSVTAIPLETKSECLMPYIRKVKFSDKYIYVSDNQFVYRFNYDGKFIKKINRVGRGPGEISTFTDFYVDPKNDEVYILSRKLQMYDGDGSLVKEFPMQNLPLQVQIVESSLWLNTIQFADKPGSDNSYHIISRLFRLNKDGLPVDSIVIRDLKYDFSFGYINAGDEYYSFLGNSSYFFYPSRLISPETPDTLFQFKNNKLIPAFKFNFGDKLYNLNRNQKAEKSPNGINALLRINSIFVTSHFLFSSYSIEKSDYFVCHNTKSGKTYNMETGFVDDTYNTGNVQLKQFNFATDRLYFTKDGYEVAGKVKGIDENSNPVIFIVKLKE